jgi:hypothetical protein
MFYAILVALAIVGLSIWLKRRAPTSDPHVPPPTILDEPSPYAHLAGTFDEDEVTEKEKEKEKATQKLRSIPQVVEKESQGECCGGGSCGSKKQEEASGSCCSSNEDSCCSSKEVSIIT